MKIGTWVRPEIREGEFTSTRYNPNKVHYVSELAPGGEWRPLCSGRARPHYTLLPGPEEPDAIDRCMVCRNAAGRWLP